MNDKVGFYSLFLILIFMIGCEKESDLPFSEVPQISLVSLSHDTIIEYNEVLSIKIFYQDGDGDLGFEDPETYAVYIRDSRLESFDGFYLGPVAPPGQIISVQGNLTVEFPSLFVFGNRTEESTRFFIYMIDRAGNKSNELMTEPVIIKKPG